jgi:D-xylose transport system ATP-binding protein
VRAGEIVGIGGLLGSGRSELLRHLFGAYGTRLAGEVKLRGQPFAPTAPHESLAKGVVLLSEERRRDGLCMDATVSDNFSLSSLDQLVPGKVGLARLCGLLDPRKERERNLKMAGRVRLRSAAATGESEKLLALRARALSGGNQQKVVLGKALLAAPQLLLLDEPTRGVDIGAKQDLYELICELCAGGLGVLLVSSELPELLGLCDRILVLADGQIAGEFSRRKATAEDLLTAALGASARRGKPERMNRAATPLQGAAPSPASEPAP